MENPNNQNLKQILEFRDLGIQEFANGFVIDNPSIPQSPNFVVSERLSNSGKRYLG